MKNQKPLSDYQKRRLVVAMEALNNPIFSTNTPNASGNQLFSILPDAYSAKTLPQPLNFGVMESAETTYTTPRLCKGKAIDFVPKGSTKAKEEAKQSWYVEFFFYNPGIGEMERFRFSKNLNRIKKTFALY